VADTRCARRAVMVGFGRVKTGNEEAANELERELILDSLTATQAALSTRVFAAAFSAKRRWCGSLNCGFIGEGMSTTS
jgi:hypothetical protein